MKKEENYHQEVRNDSSQSSSSNREKKLTNSKSAQKEAILNAPTSVDRVGGEVDSMFIITVIKAEHLPREDLLGTVDAYCVFKVGNREFFQTQIRKRTHNPSWKESHRVLVYQSERKYNINIEIWDWDKVSKNDLIGTAFIDLQRYQNAKNEKVSLTIINDKNKKNSQIDLEITRETFADVEQQFWKSMLEYFDQDHDGELQFHEFAAMLEAVGTPMTQDQLESIFRYLDTNSSNTVSIIEIMEKVKNSGPDTESNPLMKELLPHDPNFIWVVMSNVDPNPQHEGENVVAKTVMEDSRWRTQVEMPRHLQKNGEVGHSRLVVHDRKTGNLVEEKMPNYIKVAMRIMYTGRTGKITGDARKLRMLLHVLTERQGRVYNKSESAKDIRPFIKFHNLNEEEMLHDITYYKNFNEFFYRKLKKGARPIEEKSNPKVVVSPADCRISVFETVTDAHKLWIKGNKFSLRTILTTYKGETSHEHHHFNLLHKKEEGGSEDEEYTSNRLFQKFEGGSIAVCRLAPQDYHRFHCPVSNAKLKQTTLIKGAYYTVNPIAVNNVDANVFGENKREVCVMDTEQFGEMVYVLVGATMVGSIVLTCKEGATLKKGGEVGHFAFGGSSVLLLFEKGTMQWDKDLIENSRNELETLVRMGERIGIGTKAGSDFIEENQSDEEVEPEREGDRSGDHQGKLSKLKNLITHKNHDS